MLKHINYGTCQKFRFAIMLKNANISDELCASANSKVHSKCSKINAL